MEKWTHRKFIIEVSMRKKYWRHKRRFYIPCSRWQSKIVSKRPRTPRTPGRASTHRIKRSRWSSRWLLLSSSQWTWSSTLCVEGWNIPNSTETHWCNKVYSHWSGRHARETCRWLLECRFERKPVRILERIHEVYSIESKISEGIYVVRGETDKSSNDFQIRSCMARSMDQNWWSRSN